MARINLKLLVIVLSLALLAGFTMAFYLLFFYITPQVGRGVALSNPVLDNKGLANDSFQNSLTVNRDRTVKLIFFGDLMIDRNVKTKIDKYGMNYLFAQVASSSEWQNVITSDLVIANLEGAVTNGGKHYQPDMAYDFAFAPERINELKNYGFNSFNIANNHLADQGENGIIETNKNLDELDIFYFGCNDKQVGECSARIKEISGKKIGFAGFSMVYGELNKDKVVSEIKNLKAKSDLVIVNIHWGEEYQHQFNKKQQDLAYVMIDAGADIIIGHHPHVVQGVEIYKNKPIFYSLGNFIFDQYFSQDTQEGLGLAIESNSSDNRILLLPLKSKASQLELIVGYEKEKFLNKFISWSKLTDEQSKQISFGEIEL